MTSSVDSTPELRLVLADDHRLVRAGIRMLLESVPGWRVVAEAGDGDAALREVLDHRPDILVLDLGMPGRPSLGLLPELARRAPDTRVVVVTMQSDPALARAALAAGAAGYVFKEAADAELEQAIRAVARGGSYLDPSLGALVAAARPEDDDHGLSDREVEVLRLIALGHTNAEIATVLCLSVRTVESHRSHILEKTGCRTRAQLVQFALGEDLDRPAPPAHDRTEPPMTARLAINGFGRIGRAVVRAAIERDADLDIVAVNDVVDVATLAQLLARDSVYGRFPHPVGTDGDAIVVAGRRIARAAAPEPEALPWEELGVDVVIEATGRFRTRARRRGAPEAGARKVILSAPAKGAEPADAERRPGRELRRPPTTPQRHHIITNASCTTNCLAPVAKVLHEAVGIRHGLMTTIHAYTADQNLLDGPHKDLRRARAAALNLVPTSTGAAKALGLVIPELAGRLNGFAVRVPIPTGSIVDLTIEAERADERRGGQRRVRRGRRDRTARRHPRSTARSRSSPRTSSARPTRRSSTPR